MLLLSRRVLLINGENGVSHFFVSKGKENKTEKEMIFKEDVFSLLLDGKPVMSADNLRWKDFYSSFFQMKKSEGKVTGNDCREDNYLLDEKEEDVLFVNVVGAGFPDFFASLISNDINDLFVLPRKILSDEDSKDVFNRMLSHVESVKEVLKSSLKKYIIDLMKYNPKEYKTINHQIDIIMTSFWDKISKNFQSLCLIENIDETDAPEEFKNYVWEVASGIMHDIGERYLNTMKSDEVMSLAEILIRFDLKKKEFIKVGKGK